MALYGSLGSSWGKFFVGSYFSCYLQEKNFSPLVIYVIGHKGGPWQSRCWAEFWRPVTSAYCCPETGQVTCLGTGLLGILWLAMDPSWKNKGAPLEVRSCTYCQDGSNYRWAMVESSGQQHGGITWVMSHWHTGWPRQQRCSRRAASSNIGQCCIPDAQRSDGRPQNSH